jgi:hypothetical protein
MSIAELDFKGVFGTIICKAHKQLAYVYMQNL